MNTPLPNFDQPEIGTALAGMAEAVLDELSFGVIGFDSDTVVCLYNTFESRHSGLSREKVIGNAFFTVVAPCMNNFLVAQRFQDVHGTGEALDETIDYVLTLRMRPVKVRLRLVAQPDCAMRYVLVYRAV